MTRFSPNEIIRSELANAALDQIADSVPPADNRGQRQRLYPRGFWAEIVSNEGSGVYTIKRKQHDGNGGLEDQDDTTAHNAIEVNGNDALTAGDIVWAWWLGHDDSDTGSLLYAFRATRDPASSSDGGDSTATSVCDTVVLADGDEVELDANDWRGRFAHAMIAEAGASAAQTWNADWKMVECCATGDNNVGASKTVNSVVAQVFVDGDDGGKLKIKGTGGSGNEAEFDVYARSRCSTCPDDDPCAGIGDFDLEYLVSLDWAFEAFTSTDCTTGGGGQTTGSITDARMRRCGSGTGEIADVDQSSSAFPVTCGYQLDDDQNEVGDVPAGADLGDALNLYVSDDPCTDGYAYRVALSSYDFVEGTADKQGGATPAGSYASNGFACFDAGSSSLHIKITNVVVEEVVA